MNNSFRENLLKNLVLIGALSSFLNLPVLYSISSLFAGMVIVFGIGYSILYLLLKKNILSYPTASKVALFIVFIQIINIPFHAGVDTFFLPWMLITPVLAFSLISTKNGLIYSVALLFVFLLTFFLNLIHDSYTIIQIFNFITLYLSIVFASYYISKNVEDKELMLSQQNAQLENMNYTLTNSVEVATRSLELQNEKLKESVDNFQDLLDTTMEMIVLLDKNENILDINLSGISMLGYENKTEVIGTNISQYIKKNELETLKKVFQENIDTSYEINLIKKDNTSFIALASARDIHREKDEIRIITLMDLTEIKNKEKLLQQQTRLAQMGEMISMIAHQWRQPLGAINNTVSSIQIKQELEIFNLEDKKERDEFITFINQKHKDINDYTQVLTHTIDDFRNFFKPNKDKELTPLSNPIQRALQIVELSMEAKNIKIIKDFSSDNKILMYQNELMQVILNILKNSEDNFIEKGIVDRKIIIKTYQNSNQLNISLEDNAGGIPEDIIANIFDPYFSTKKEKDGTGLGLYMSKIMVEKHNGGKLNAYNTQHGACFTITLPNK